jgi:hypothetical protein
VCHTPDIIAHCPLQAGVQDAPNHLLGSTALRIPPQSGDGVGESGWRLGRLLSDYESAEASTPRSVAKTDAVPSGESKEEGRCLTQRENWKDRLGQK